MQNENDVLEFTRKEIERVKQIEEEEAQEMKQQELARKATVRSYFSLSGFACCCKKKNSTQSTTTSTKVGKASKAKPSRCPIVPSICAIF